MSVCRTCLREDDGDADETVCEECAHRIAMAVTGPSDADIERAARAAHDIYSDGVISYEERGESSREVWRRIARVVASVLKGGGR